jgi:hypothetical protein
MPHDALIHDQFDVRLARVARKSKLPERTKSTLLPHQCQGLYPQITQLHQLLKRAAY